MTDYATRKRQLMIARMSHDLRRYLSTLCNSRNAKGLDREEWAYWISERAALIFSAVIVYGVWEIL